MQRTLKEIAGFVQAQLLGDSSVEVEGVASIQSASANDLVFAEDEGSLGEAGASRAAGIIVGKFAVKTSSAKPLLICEHPRLAFARAASFLAEPERHESGVHHSAVIHPSARIAEGVSVEAYVTISEGVVIGSGTHIGPGSHIGAHATLGENCNLVGNVTIYPGVKLGNRVIVHAGAVLGSDGFGYVRDSTSGRYEKFPQIGRLEIGDDVEIGANTTIDRGALDATVVGSGVKIDNLVHIAHNVSIGKHVVIAAQTGVSGSSVIEDNVIVAGQVGIADHVRIEEGAILGAQSGIPSNKVIRGKGIVFWGTPARPIREHLRELAVLARLAKKR